MLKLEANIFPKFEVEEADIPNLERIMSNLTHLERLMLETRLHEGPTVSLKSVEFDAGMEHSWGFAENYEFVITRRYRYNEEWHVGGANGEILNVYTFISGFKRFLEEQIALRDSQK